MGWYPTRFGLAFDDELFRALTSFKEDLMKTQDHSAYYQINATRVIVSIIGVFFGFSGINHGFFEVLQGNTPTNGFVIQAIGEHHRFWPEGTEEAFTVIPNFLVSGVLSMLIGLVIMIWSIGYIHKKHGRTVFLALFILLFLVGGGIGQVAFFMPAWAFATRMDKPLNGWKRILPQRIWPFLSKLWVDTLIIATTLMAIGLEIAIFGLVPGVTNPATIQNTALLSVLFAALLYPITFIAGFGHDLRRKYQTL